MRRQQGFTITILLVAVLSAVAAAGVGGAIWTWKSALQKAEKAEAEASKLRGRLGEALAELEQSKLLRAQQDRVLADRRGRQLAEDELMRRVDNVLGKLLQTPEVRSWALERVPADVVNGLRNSPDSTRPKDMPSPTRKPALKPTSSGLAWRDDKLGLASDCTPVSWHCAFVQRGQGSTACFVPAI